jgi:hypothetical protein
MNFSKLINSDIQNYINQNLNSDLTKLLLKKSPFPDISIQQIVQQIKGRKIAEKKFPFLAKEGIIFLQISILSKLHLNQPQNTKLKILKENLFLI